MHVVVVFFPSVCLLHAACPLRCLTCQGRADTEAYGSIITSIKLKNRSLNTTLKALAQPPDCPYPPQRQPRHHIRHWQQWQTENGCCQRGARHSSQPPRCKLSAALQQICEIHLNLLCHPHLCTSVCWLRHPLQENTCVILCEQDGSAGRHDLCEGLPDVVFGEHSRQTVAHLVRYWQEPLWVHTWFKKVTQIDSLKTKKNITSWAHSSPRFHYAG